MATKTVPVTFGFGMRDRVDPKLAPFGVLKTGKNVRLRKDGRLGSRRGYWLLANTTLNGDLHAYDLHEHRSRLVALGSDTGDGYPTDLFEYTGTEFMPAAWRGCDPTASRVVINPFTSPREIAGLPQPADGVSSFDAVAGGGYVCIVYASSVNTFDSYAMIVDQATDQVVHSEKISGFSATGVRALYGDGVFYIAGRNGPANLVIMRFRIGADTEFQNLLVDGSLFGITAFDVAVVTNTSLARLVVAIDRQSGQDLVIKLYDPDGSQVGSTATVAAANSTDVAVDADEADDTINVYTIESSTGALRTFNFAGTLLNGPTATTSGTSGFVGRLPAQDGFTEHIAILTNDSTNSVVIQFVDIDTHTVTETTTVQAALVTAKPVSGQSPNQPMALVFAGVVGGDLDAVDGHTNALFFVTPEVAHMSTRDTRAARRRSSIPGQTLSVDTITGALCWPALRDPGNEIDFPVVTLVDFKSTDRRQSVPFGGLLYFAGCTPSVYDGRFPVPLNFGELPDIYSLTPSASSGDLEQEASYSYVAHWEYVLADGSVIVGPVSDPVQVFTGTSGQRVTASVSTPHTVPIALGDALYGANVSVILSRTVWEANARIEGSVFRRCVSDPASPGMANYGEPLPIADTASDAEVSERGAVYTQAARGVVTAPLQHFAPLGCSNITATEARLVTGGLARQHEVQISKGAFIGEAFEFSPLSQYFATVAGPVRGVRHLDGNKLVFTSDRIYVLPGDGPDDIGAGTLDYPREIPTPGGLSNPWSFLEAPDGLWFQLDGTKLFRIPRGGGAPTWEGIDVEETLREYPEIVGAAKCKHDNVAVFACNRPAGGARLLIRDFRTEQWFVDEPPLSEALGRIDAITSWGDTIAYASGGRVWYLASSPSALWDEPIGVVQQFIETQVVTHPLYPFGLGGYGQIYDCLITGSVKGGQSIVLGARVSYDDGLTFEELDSFTIAGDTAGTTVQRKWTLPKDVTSSVVFEFTVTQNASDFIEGFAFNQIDLLVEPEDGLRELTPAEMA